MQNIQTSRPQMSLARSARGRTLAVGFGTTTTMWMVAYFSLMQPGLVVGEYALFHVTAADVMGFATDPLMFQDFREVWLDR